MKKILTTVAVLVAVVLLACCGGGLGAPAKSETQKAAEKAVQCLKDKDYKGYVDMLYANERELASPDKLAQEREQYAELLKGKAEESAKKKGVKDLVVDYSFVSEEVDSLSAVVRMAITDGANNVDTTDVKLRKDVNGDWKIVMGK